MKKRLFFIVVSILLLSSTIFAQEPTGYYDDADGKTGADLKTALFSIISSHTALSYSGLWTAYYNTDAKTNGKVWDMYSDVPGGTPPYEYTFGSGQCGTYGGEGDCYNREHSFPKSWFNEASPMVTDIFHIYPTDGYVNGHRSNYPFGEISSPTWTSENGSKLGPCSFSGYSGTVFEPIDEYKGDFARSYFYMATCYEDKISGWSSPMLDGTSYPAYTTWAVNLLLKWDSEDPVSEKEIDRNNEVYDNYQHNRNPFIDHPEFVNSIWGETSTPSISNVTISPENPKSSDEVTISANITDNGTISSAKISWCTDGSSFDNNITMTVSSDNAYQSDTNIPAQTDGTTVSYKISATDDENNTTTSNRSYTIENNPALTILFEDFNEGDLGIFTQYSVIGDDQIWEPYEYEGSFYPKMSNYDGTKSNANEDWLISPSLNLENYQNILFSFLSSMKEFGTDNTFEIFISSDYDGTSNPSNASFSWTNLTSSCTFSSGEYAWTNSGDIDISSFNQSSVYVAFVYASGANDGKTWQIDDFKVTAKEKTSNSPAISDISLSPEIPTINDAVDVFADITDDGTISSAVVLWCTDGTNFDNNINMSVSTKNTYMTDSKIPVQAEGIKIYYKIQAIDNDNDTTISITNNYIVKLLAPVIVGENKICEGDSSMLSLNSGSYESYKWRMQGNSEIIGTDSIYYALTQGDYTVAVFLQGDSATSSAFTLTINKRPISEFSFIINDKTVSFTDKSSFGDSLMWNFNDGITNRSQNPIHTFNSYDNYNVVFTVTNQCGSDSSKQDISLQSNSINSIENTQSIKLFPNPVNNILTLSTDNNNERVEIYNIIGEKVLSFYKQKADLQVNVSNLNKGMYFVKLYDDKFGIKTSSFIKN